MDPIQPGAQQVESKKNIGPIIGVIVIIVLLIIAALYLWGEKLTGSDTNIDITQTVLEGSNQNVGAADEPLSGSDDIDTIEAELTDTGTVEVDLSGLE